MIEQDFHRIATDLRQWVEDNNLHDKARQDFQSRIDVHLKDKRTSKPDEKNITKNDLVLKYHYDTYDFAVDKDVDYDQRLFVTSKFMIYVPDKDGNWHQNLRPIGEYIAIFDTSGRLDDSIIQFGQKEK